MTEEQRLEDEKDFQEISSKLEEAAFLNIVTSSQEWAVLHKAWKHIADKAREALITTNPHDWQRIATLQVQAQFYDEVIGNTIKVIKEEGKDAYEAAKEQNLLHKVMSAIKKHI